MNPVSTIFVASLVIVAALFATPAASNSSSISMRGIGDSCSDTGLINGNVGSSCCTVQSCCPNLGLNAFNCGNENNLLGNDTTIGVVGGAVSNVLSNKCGDGGTCSGSGKQCFNVIPVTTTALGVAFQTCCSSTGLSSPTDCDNNVQCNQQNAAGTYFACCNTNCS